MNHDYPPIADYGAIGDCRTVALVSRLGSIDWWCQPRFDAPSLFARILDAEEGGALWIEADGLRSAGRRYEGDSAVLRTALETDHGALEITDFLAIEGRDDGDRAPAPFARQKLVRIVRCERGRVPVRIRCRPRPGYATARPRLTLAGPHGARRRTLALSLPNRRRVLFESSVDWGPIRDGEGTIEETIGPDEELAIAVDYGEGDLAGEGVEHVETRGERAVDLDELRGWLDDTLRFWRDWVEHGTYDGPYRALVRRSAITLKLLTYHPTGAIVAAATTSLPEEIGGERNWDYRFTWLRDATFTLYALNTLGYRAESQAFMEWLTRTCSQQSDPLVLYRVDGAVPGRERTLDHLEGYRCSRPVRIGNGAAWQRQLDIYGEVLDAAYLSVRAGNELDDEEWGLLASFADYAAERWRRADTSIWEVRGGRRHFTYSKVLCWVALDRARRIAEHSERAAAEAGRIGRWRHEAEEIRRAVFARGRRKDGAFVQYFDGDAIDASALLFPLVGFVKAESPAATATLEAVRRTLEHDGLVLRYLPDEAVEGVSGGEGHFLITSYWLCDNLALRGDLDEARRRFEELSAHANDLGLFSEEVGGDGTLLGNFPQAFTHIALISTAHNLERAAEGRMAGRVRREAPHDEPTDGRAGGRGRR